jgi:hypothetical protein
LIDIRLGIARSTASPSEKLERCSSKEISMKINMPRVVALLVVLGSAFVVTSAQAQNAYVYVAHAASGRSVSSAASPSFPVDFSVNGTCIAKGITFGQIAGPWSWPAGPYALQFTAANTVTPCSGAAVYTSSIMVAADSTYIGVLTLDASNNVIGQLYMPDLSSITVNTYGRIEIINASQDILSATLSSPSNGTAAAGVTPGNIISANAASGLYTSTITSQSGTVVVGPINAQIEQRNWYLYVITGSTANNTVQLIGPKVIKGVF